MGTGFDNWYPGFMDHANNFHNVAAFLTETGLYRYATPHFYTIDDFPERSRDLRPQSLYASPWEGGWWHLRDAVDYMLTASISVLDVAAKYREDVLYNRYQAGRDVIQAHTQHPPYAYFVRQEQRDPVAAVELLRRLAFNGIEIAQLTRAVTFEGLAFPAGTWVIPMDQEFANFVRQLFAIQQYPDLREFPEGPPDQPYDVAGWTLPAQMGVEVVEARAPLTSELRDAMQAVQDTPVAWDTEADASTFDTPPDVGFDTHPVATAIVPPPGAISGSGPAVVLDPRQNNTFRALNRAWQRGARVAFVGGQPDTTGAPGTSGYYAVRGLGNDAVQQIVADYALQARRSNDAGTELARPRIGMYRPWSPSMDEGWTRWLAEMYEFTFSNVYNSDVLAGDLRSRYDVIMIADMSTRQIMEGFTRGAVPPRYAGGLGAEGVRALDTFVRMGGTLVCLNGSSDFAIAQLHLPVKNVVGEVERENFFLSGSIIEMTVDPSHPVMAGMPERSKVFVSRSPVFTVTDEFQGAVLAKYQEKGSPLVSGYLLGEEHLHGFAAALDVRHGDGHVVLLGMRPQWRGQPFGNFRIVFNALLYTREMAATVRPNGAFWTAPEPETEATAEENRGS
jgi:hypothetical protein